MRGSEVDARRVLHRTLSEAGAPYPAVNSAIGLFGGSFYPPHGGHILVASYALERLRLNQVWFIPTLGNPFKSEVELPGVFERVEGIREMLSARRGLFALRWEEHVGVVRTYESVRLLRGAAPGVRFVWLAGADILEEIHRWHCWRELLDMVPLAIFDRRPYGGRVLNGRFADMYRGHRVMSPSILARSDPPAWCFVRQPCLDISGRELRGGMEV